MKRVFLKVAYDGTEYVGWQMQPNGTAVEEVINNHLSQLLNEEIAIIGASRTDSGVHALGNVAVFDTETRIPADKICFALNQRLPGDIVITDSFEVAADFHPRRAKCRKTYEYRIYNATHPNPIVRRYSHFIYIPLDVEAMRKAAGYIIGEHDFASFCSAHGQQKTTIRTIYGLEISIDSEESTKGSGGCFFDNDLNIDRQSAIDSEKRIVSPGGISRNEKKEGAGMIRIKITGNGFLYNMVRIIVGTLIKVGHHVYPPEHVKEIIEACDRQAAGPCAPAQGLTLVGIQYETDN